MSTTSTSRATAIIGWLSAVSVVVSAAALWYWPRPAGVSPDDDGASKGGPISLVVSGDTAGWIVPCGCTSNQSGGLPRRATYVNSLRQSGEAIYVDAGGAPGGTSLYETLRFEAILSGEKAMGVVAHNVGAAEAKLGEDTLRRVSAELDVPFVSANVRDKQGNLLFDAFKTVTLAGRRIALVGVLSQKYAVDALQFADPKASVLLALDEIRKSGSCDDVVVLAYLPADELRTFAAEMPEADLIVGGPTGQAIAPEKTGNRWLAAATNKGKFLARFFIDQPQLSWQGEMVELNEQFIDDSTQKSNLAEFYKVLERKDVSAAQTGFALALPIETPTEFRAAGTAACMQCHDADCRLWNDSKHAHAWKTLSSRGSHVDSYCQQCHTTGFGLPGGFQSVKQSPELVNVGCESCHGPSSAHAKRPDQHTPFVARDQCTRCHDRENSPKFEYASYWAQIQHGQPAEATDVQPTEQQQKSERKP